MVGVGVVALVVLYITCSPLFNLSNGATGKGGTQRLSKQAGIKGSDSYSIKQQRFDMLMKTSRQRYVQLHPEFQSKFDEIHSNSATKSTKQEATKLANPDKPHAQ